MTQCSSTCSLDFGASKQYDSQWVKKRRWKGNKGMFEYLFSHCLALGPTASGRDPWMRRTQFTLLEMLLFRIPVPTAEAHCEEKNNSEIPHFLFQRYPS